MKTGVELIFEERIQQLEQDCYTLRKNPVGIFIEAARAYMTESLRPGSGLFFWPYEREKFEPSTPSRNLVKAGAMIAAAIDRLQAETAASDELLASMAQKNNHPESKEN